MGLFGSIGKAFKEVIPAAKDLAAGMGKAQDAVERTLAPIAKPIQKATHVVALPDLKPIAKAATEIAVVAIQEQGKTARSIVGAGSQGFQTVVKNSPASFAAQAAKQLPGAVNVVTDAGKSLKIDLNPFDDIGDTVEGVADSAKSMVTKIVIGAVVVTLLLIVGVIGLVLVAKRKK